MHRVSALLVLLLAGVAAAQQPLDVDLLLNGGFEAGALVGWTPVAGSTAVSVYGANADLPASAVAFAISGGLFLLEDVGSNSVVRQVVDVSGNAAAINAGTLVLDLTADLGGILAQGDTARVRARFFNNIGVPAPGVQLGDAVLQDVTADERNLESVLMRRNVRAPIPSGTTEIRIDLEFSNVGTGTAYACLDNVVAMLTAAAPVAPKPLDVNLIVNGGFEAGWTASSPLSLTNLQSWVGQPGGATSASAYGSSTNVPTLLLASAVSGGARLLVDAGEDATIRQSIDISGNAVVAPGYEVVIEACLGGWSTQADYGEVVVEFLSSGGLVLDGRTLGPVTTAGRNEEDVVVRRRMTAFVPPQTAILRVEVRFRDFGNGAHGVADNIDVRLRPIQFPPLPALGAEMIVNGGFENGWTPTSPLTPGDSDGWIGIVNPVFTEVYGASTSVPSIAVGAAVGGGGRFCRGSATGGSGTLRQDFDVRAGAAQIDIGALSLDVSALLGGSGVDPDSGRIDIVFLDSTEDTALQIGPTQSVGPVTNAHRSNETIVMRRRRIVAIPPLTRRIRVDAVFSALSIPTNTAIIDEVSVKLVATPPPATAPLGVQLLANGDFESGPIPGLPFLLSSEQDWEGHVNAGATTPAYGSGTFLPSIAFSTAISGGNRLAADEGNGVLRQTFDVSANPETSLGTLRIHVEGWFGGYAADPDTSRLEVDAIDAVGGVIVIGVVGNVTSAERALSTLPGAPNVLLFRQGDFTVPVGTMQVRIRLVFQVSNGPNAQGIADNLAATFYDSTSGGADEYPGTGGNTDLHLFTGLDALPTTGPAFDVKDALPGQILYLKLSSFGGNADFAPIIIAFQPFVTGVPPVPVFAGVALVPANAVILVDGVTFLGAFGQPVLLPGGSNFASVIPAGLAGASVLIQGFAFPTFVGLPVVPPNGIFFAAAAHEIRFL